jgi:hypothetical protein
MEGHEKYIKIQKGMLEEIGFSKVSVFKDLAKRNRIILGYKGLEK